jgi:hypothetical protein
MRPNDTCDKPNDNSLKRIRQAAPEQVLRLRPILEDLDKLCPEAARAELAAVWRAYDAYWTARSKMEDRALELWRRVEALQKAGLT